MIFIGNFMLLTHQEKIDEADRRHGEFSLIVEAPTNELAIGLFREKLLKLRSTSTMFEGQCTIFFTHLMEFDRFPSDEAMILNYRSWAGDPQLPYIGCAFPTGYTDGCRIHEWRHNRPEIDGMDERLFLEFRA